MLARDRPRRIPPAGAAQAVLAFGTGVAFGGLISVAAFLLARYGPSAGDWSFRGNGALAAYSLILPVLAGGWTAIVLHRRGRRWASLSALVALVGVGLAAIDAALLPVFGSSTDQSLGLYVLIALAGWTALAPLLALTLPRRAPAPSSVGWPIAAAVTLAAGVVIGLTIVGIVIPAGS